MYRLEINKDAIRKIGEEAEALKKLIEDIKNHFQVRGKRIRDEEIDFWSRDKSLLFDPSKYAELKNSEYRKRVQNILRLLTEVFPWFSTIPFNIEEEFVFVADDREFCSVDTSKFSWKSGLSPFAALVHICERLNDPSLVRELYKPVFVALAYILHNSGKEFRDSDFADRFRPYVLEKATSMAEREGWLSLGEDGFYQIIKKPPLKISCAYCKETVFADEENCPKCGFYILNIALKRRKRTEEGIPSELFEFSPKTEWKAYFYYSSPHEIIEMAPPDFIDHVCEFVYYKTDIAEEIFNIALENARKENLIFEVPDFIAFAERYTEEFGALIKIDSEKKYFMIKAISPESLQEKLRIIKERIKVRAGQVYDHEIERWNSFGHDGKKSKQGIRQSRDDVINKVLLWCKSAFVPPLDEHPINEVKTKQAELLVKCSKCGEEMPKEAAFCGNCGARLDAWHRTKDTPKK